MNDILDDQDVSNVRLYVSERMSNINFPFIQFKSLERLEDDVIVNPISLNDIKQKVDTMVYDSLEAFLVDIECIYHNYSICSKQ